VSVSSAIAPASLLLAWYDRHRRTLPWRAAPGETADPYRVWLSEVMLQQTTVTAAIPYFERFVRRFPDVATLAQASLEEVLGAWAGLGYYARARNLHACARTVAASGGFPRDAAGLRVLPGIGAYTATAVAAIAFGEPGVPIDGNVERVIARLFAIEAPLPAAKAMIRNAARMLGADGGARARPSDFAQALFDLGATICTPITPACALCPWAGGCEARLRGLQAELPRKAPKRDRPLRHGVHFRLQDAEGRILLRRRPPSGLLGGMAELPGTEWRTEAWAEAEALAFAPMQAEWRRAGEVRHGFTHFELRVQVYAATVQCITAEGVLHAPVSMAGAGLSSLMRKCVRAGTG